MTKLIIHGCTPLALCLAMALASGCASGGRAPEGEKAIQSIQDVHDQLIKAKDQVNRTLMLMSQLQETGDLQKTFKSFSEAVTDLKDAGDAAAKRGQAMREKREEYLAKWQEDVKDVQNPDVKESLELRRQRVRDNFERLTAMANDVKAAYQPFLQDLTDIQRALAIDLNPAGVSAMKPAMQKSKTDGDAVAKKIDALATELSTLLGKIAPKPA